MKRSHLTSLQDTKMATLTLSKDKKIKWEPTHQAVLAGVGLVLAFILTLASFRTKQHGATIVSSLMGAEDVHLKMNPKERLEENPSFVPEITLGEAGRIPFYHCTTRGKEYATTLPLVLLHGAAFTKEDWKKPPQKIMEQLCSQSTLHSISVFAADLPKTADYRELQQFLTALEQAKQVELPVSLVTPSASGNTMVTWAAALESGSSNPQELNRFIKQWIPVAANKVNGSPEAEIQKLHGLPILSIFGDQDNAGRKSSQKLTDLVGAKALELEGRHPCYLDSPEEFVSAVIEFVES